MSTMGPMTYLVTGARLPAQPALALALWGMLRWHVIVTLQQTARRA